MLLEVILVGYRPLVRERSSRIDRNEADDAPGPAQDVVRTEEGSSRTPLLPEVVSLGDLAPGWHQIDADLVVDKDGTARLCEPVPDAEPVAGTGQSHCPPGASEVTALDLRPPEEFRMFGPLVVRVDQDRQIDGVYPIRGFGGA